MNEDADAAFKWQCQEKREPQNNKKKRGSKSKPEQAARRMERERRWEREGEGERLLLRGRMPAQVILIACQESGINRWTSYPQTKVARQQQQKQHKIKSENQKARTTLSLCSQGSQMSRCLDEGWNQTKRNENCKSRIFAARYAKAAHIL